MTDGIAPVGLFRVIVPLYEFPVSVGLWIFEIPSNWGILVSGMLSVSPASGDAHLSPAPGL